MGAANAISYNYTYDVNGNLLTDPKNSVSNIGYSFFDELPVSITNLSGQHNYRYFGGTRSVKEISTTDREYYIDQVILDQNGVVKSYQTVGGYAIPNGSSATYLYQVKDWLGSPHITLNASGSILNGTDYYPYGKPMPGRSNYGTNYEGYRYQFTGHERDGETNYQYHGARYYNEELARYMSVDPWADKYANWSTYNYAMSNPLTFIDPTGKGVDYTEDEAAAMAARGITNGYLTQVRANPNKKDDYGVFYSKTKGGRLYEGVQYDGKFTGIGKAGLVSKKEVERRHMELSREAVYNTFGPPKATGSCYPCSIADPIIQAGQEGLSNGLQGLGMSEQNANYASAGVFLIGSVMLSRKIGSLNSVSKTKSLNVYRVFGGDSRAEGFSWTPVNPTTIGNYRNVAGLPSGGASGSINTAEFMIKGTVNPSNIIKSRAALPLDGNIGGFPELIIDPKNITITDFSVIKH